MMRVTRHVLSALLLPAMCIAIPPCLGENQTAQTQPATTASQRSGSVTVDDICSTGPSSYMRDLGPHSPIAACILGDTVLYKMKDGKRKADTEVSRSPQHLIMSGMYTKFKNQKEIIGQANLTLQIDSERNYKLLSQTIYVPGCAPFHAGAEIPPAAKEFCEQIKSAVETVPLTELTIGNPEVESMIFEVVIGRDPEIFPRYGTRFNGFFRVDKDGNVNESERK